MKFFVPCKHDDETDEQAYLRIRAITERSYSTWKITSDRILGLHHMHNGKRYYSEVGKPDPEVRELVTAIFSTGKGGAFIVCTHTRGGGTYPGMADGEGTPIFFEVD